MIFILLFIGILSLLRNALTGWWIFPELTEVDRMGYNVIFWVALAGASILIKLEEIKNALAKGQTPKGLHSNGRTTGHVLRASYAEAPESGPLVGHWHKGRWNPDFGLGKDRKWQETRLATECYYYWSSQPIDCPDRNPRSDDGPPRRNSQSRDRTLSSL